MGKFSGNTETPKEDAENKKTLLEQRLEKQKHIIEAAKVELDVEGSINENPNPKEIFTVFGHKNDSKTATAYGIPRSGETMFVLSFDHKSERPMSELSFVKDSGVTITVANAVKYWDKSDKDLMRETAETTYIFINKLLQYAKENIQPDWIVIDGTEIMNKILEMVMRKRNGILPFAGISNLNVWKERTQYIDDIHSKSINIAKKGVIYTMYIEKDEVIKEGVVLLKKDIPKWVGNVMYETDIVIRVDSDFKDGKRTFKAIIESSKIPSKYPEGVYEITNKRLIDAIDNGPIPVVR